MQTVTKKINVAPSSTEGHWVEKAKQVIELDKINETFMVKGQAIITTKNHTTLEIKEDSLITCQRVYNPFAQMFKKSKD
jgi:hypothetical protein